ncbi:hypothetical protein ACFWU3_15875 [Streptomyces sp. NPDC058685]|uniref:hypothetical protein n=1 Tax=Streptomyces sp. NPDC058685 TaxID=3346598 RepID=UPI00366293BA
MPSDARTKACPSAQPDMPGSTVLGIVEGTADDPEVRYLASPVPAAAEITSLAGDLLPTEVFRFSADCVESNCRHFDGRDCSLAKRITAVLPPVIDVLPRCHARPSCRWWHQEGAAACFRCPQVVTTTVWPTPEQMTVAEPSQTGETHAS